MTDDTEEQDLEILEDLAKIKDIKDFRLGAFMREHGMNPSQPTIFYGALLKACRGNESLIKWLDDTINSDSKRIVQFKVDAIKKDSEIKRLAARVSDLEGEASKNTGNQGLLATISELQDKVSKLQGKALMYNAIVQLLIGESKPHTLKVLHELFYNLYMYAMEAVADEIPPPDPANLEKARQILWQELRDILRIPPEEWEKEMDALRARIVELEKDNQALAVVNLVEYQQALKDKTPDETEEPQENNKAMTQEDFMKHLQDLVDKHSNEADRGEGVDTV